MDHAQTAGPPVVKDTLTMSISGDTPQLLATRIRRCQKEWTVDALSPYRSGVYDFDDSRFRRDAPTLAARAGMAALVPGVKIEAKRRHVRIIAGSMLQRQSDRADENVIETAQAITKVKLHAAA
jgi:hypothetical protein